MLTISVVLNVLGIQPYLTAQGLNLGSLMAFCLVWGFGGAFISLALSRIMAKWMMGVRIIKEDETDMRLRELVATVHRLAREAGLRVMPEVGIYQAYELNAFATGPTRNRSLVAVSTGLLERMTPDEVEGVLGHEIAHISNGDMVTMTLLQGVVNAFVMFFARVIAYTVSNAVNNRNLRPMVHMITVIALDILLGILGMIVVAKFSRYREYKADLGSARLAGKEKMISALRALEQNMHLPPAETPPSLANFRISSRPKGFMALFASHPPLADRIARLQTANR